MFDIVYGKDKTILRVKDTFALLRTGVFDGDERYLEISDNTIRVVKDVRNCLKPEQRQKPSVMI